MVLVMTRKVDDVAAIQLQLYGGDLTELRALWTHGKVSHLFLADLSPDANYFSEYISIDTIS